MVMFWAKISQDTEKPKNSNLIYKLLSKLDEEIVYKSLQLNNLLC